MPTTQRPTRQPSLGGLARQLVEDGLIEYEEALRIQAEAQRNDESFVARAVATRALSAAVLARALARAFSMPLLDLRAVNLDHAPIDAAPESLIRKHAALPIFRRGRTLYLAVADPTNLQALDEFRFNTGQQIEAVLVEQDKLERAIESNFNALDSAMAGLDDVALDNLAVEQDSGDTGSTDALKADADDAPVVRFVNKVLLDAINRGASDIHFEPYEQRYRVRLRQDGVLREVASPPAAIGMRLSARLKVMARLDLAERRIPQDGRIKLNLSKNRAIDFRVSTCPTLHGEKIVLRILDPASAQMGIEALGYEDAQREIFESTIHKPYGMVLVTGPTGSGKTVSLYTALNILNTADRNISTAEDPAEINLPGVNQVNVQPRVGLTFATCLRAFLRQDPDVIMVGEIRDLETAEIAIKAAQTGHMVLSTVHTNDAPQTLTRLINMGVPAYNIAASVTLIIAQRLARRLCPHCKSAAEIPRDAMIEEGFGADEIDHLKIYEADLKGCDHCTGGYRGRVGIYQVMPVTDAIGQIIMSGGNADDIERQAASEGVLNLRQAGLNKVRTGVISLAELNRVTVE
ncbi:type IV-A pilus assembly ATPase PilB [Salinisphaera hydrothermalis]|uniref:Type II secretion system protein E n=1 Tax=Salinisphaera hydrothermalis (strain C41B8) TaxID=1304275 RepID=A0A084IJL8_SALHC|nr:type IV-A pilus assembly ATPase PilB [Salinisphaera hydrothermalis]KEZ76902.1 type II secretion system protein E [Salinisphaera hydrothermalis C41B8]